MKKPYRRIVVIVLLMSVWTTLHGEQEFSLSLSPVFEVPAGKEHFGPGAGAAAALDSRLWA